MEINCIANRLEIFVNMITYLADGKIITEDIMGCLDILEIQL